MPRTARASVAGMWYHVLNRGNRRAAVFHKPADYDAFVKAMAEAHARLPVDLLGYCLMPNHFHLEAEIGVNSFFRPPAGGPPHPERSTIRLSRIARNLPTAR